MILTDPALKFFMNDLVRIQESCYRKMCQLKAVAFPDLKIKFRLTSDFLPMLRF